MSFGMMSGIFLDEFRQADSVDGHEKLGAGLDAAVVRSEVPITRDESGGVLLNGAARQDNVGRRTRGRFRVDKGARDALAQTLCQKVTRPVSVGFYDVNWQLDSAATQSDFGGGPSSG